MGVVHCGLVAGQFEGPGECAVLFDLRPEGLCELYTPEQARRVLRMVLRSDLAYGSKIMSMEDSTRLTEAFAAVSRMDEEDVRCYGNMDWQFVESNTPLGSWMPATGATFDTGVLVISRDRCACLWVEDED